MPVAPGLMAPSGVLTVGAALVLRDVVQRCLGLVWGFAAIVIGAALSALVAPASLVLASAAAFLLAEFADFAIYTPLQRRAADAGIPARVVDRRAGDQFRRVSLARPSAALRSCRGRSSASCGRSPISVHRWARAAAHVTTPAGRCRLRLRRCRRTGSRSAPARPRDTARLLRGGRGSADRMVRDLPLLLRPGDSWWPTTRGSSPRSCRPSRRGAHRHRARRSRGRRRLARAARNARRLRAGDPAGVRRRLSAQVVAPARTATWCCASTARAPRSRPPCARAGALALPPYIARPRRPTADDAADYQTVFAARPGAVAAPTAGLHFTPACCSAGRGRDRARDRHAACRPRHLPAGARRGCAAHRMHSERGGSPPKPRARSTPRGGSSRSAPPRCG